MMLRIGSLSDNEKNMIVCWIVNVAPNNKRCRQMKASTDACFSAKKQFGYSVIVLISFLRCIRQAFVSP
jgi:hypothetical protein